MLFLMVTSGHTTTQDGSVDSLALGTVWIDLTKIEMSQCVFHNKKNMDQCFTNNILIKKKNKIIAISIPLFELNMKHKILFFLYRMK